MIISKSIYVVEKGIISLLLWLSNVPFCMYMHTPHLFYNLFHWSIVDLQGVNFLSMAMQFSYTHSHTCFFRFFSIIVYHRILKTVACPTFSFSPYLLIDTYVASVCACVSCLAVSDSLWPQGLWLTRLLCPWDSPGKNTGVGCHSLLQGIFLTQGSDSGLSHCGQILYHLNHQGSPAQLVEGW